MLTKFGLLSFNQMAAQIKLLEVWKKSINVVGYPINLEPYNSHRADSEHELKTRTNRIFNDSSRLQVSQLSFNVDAARLWTMAPIGVSSATSLYAAKKSDFTTCQVITNLIK